MNRFYRSLSAKFTQSRKSRPSAREQWFHRTRLEVNALEDRVVPSVAIQFDYRYDSSGFFNDQARKDVLQAAANAITSRLNDTLDAIPAPTGNNSWTATFTNPSTGNED